MSRWEEEEKEHFISLAKCVSQLNVLLWERSDEFMVAALSARAGEVSGLSANAADAPGFQIAFELEKYSGFQTYKVSVLLSDLKSLLYKFRRVNSALFQFFFFEG